MLEGGGAQYMEGNTYLLGIIHGHFDVGNEDVIADDIAEGLGAINTGVVVPVEKIMETICQPELSKM
jgi:hypothetical protein